MSFLEKFFNFLGSIFHFKIVPYVETIPQLPPPKEDVLSGGEEGEAIEVTEYKMYAGRRTLLTNLYNLEQEITVFETSFPKEYADFFKKIEDLREEYNRKLNNLKGEGLTLDVHPEKDYNMIVGVATLEEEVKKFIEKDVKFEVISKKLQRLIVKLNVVYNVSIFYNKKKEKEKLCKQLDRAARLLEDISEEFKQCRYVARDVPLRERIVSLISYADYQIFKAKVRILRMPIDGFAKELVTVKSFAEYDTVTAFVAFIKDEISDLAELLPLISNSSYKETFKKMSSALLVDITYSTDKEAKICETEFWNKFFDFETTLLATLRSNGVEKEKASVRLIIRMDIDVNSDEVMTMPLTTACLSLNTIFSATQDYRILVLLKFIKSVSKDITYKEIYFLILLFDALELVMSSDNSLLKHIEKYIRNYPYSEKELLEKKKGVRFSNTQKEYLFAFELDYYASGILKTLDLLDIDYFIKDNKVFINAIYFKNLVNVSNALRSQTSTI